MKSRNKDVTGRSLQDDTRTFQQTSRGVYTREFVYVGVETSVTKTDRLFEGEWDSERGLLKRIVKIRPWYEDNTMIHVMVLITKVQKERNLWRHHGPDPRGVET